MWEGANVACAPRLPSQSASPPSPSALEYARLTSVLSPRCPVSRAPNRFSPTRPTCGSRSTPLGRGYRRTAGGRSTPAGSSTYNADATDSVFAGPLGNARAYPVAGVVTGFAWLPDGGSLVVIALEPRGTSTLSRLDLASGHATVVARDLDAPTLVSPVAVAPDGRRAYVALAGSGAPPPEARHEPHANRQLGIYEVDLGTGNRHAVVPAPREGDAFAPCVASGYLYWTHAVAEASAVVVPTGGGTVRLVMRGAEVPSWRPDGRQIGFVYGDWRWVDWAIDLDGGAVDVDTGGRPVGPLYPLITGYHEDFQPVWSPRGRWVAYHSHRAKTPVASYLAPGSSDDIWVRRVGAPAREPSEIRLTDFGWEAGPPDWSHDGTRLLFVSWERGGAAGVSYPYVVTIDTATGRAVE